VITVQVLLKEVSRAENALPDNNVDRAATSRCVICQDVRILTMVIVDPRRRLRPWQASCVALQGMRRAQDGSGAVNLRLEHFPVSDQNRESRLTEASYRTGLDVPCC
jgi:hypothetical protein